ncbi:hypothetical protein CC86DRAFT_413847 [Ophiobolus disseminans]|uniref:Uncharacterized protein n=1 Tax=Ophiobolus disseminans TaxID=1469910 RepID=A0A6A6ZCV8_9PLEO|nr:hypothetical protein CC86DRAFT_413847 [Ophiobolus disseminans]
MELAEQQHAVAAAQKHATELTNSHREKEAASDEKCVALQARITQLTEAQDATTATNDKTKNTLTKERDNLLHQVNDLTLERRRDEMQSDIDTDSIRQERDSLRDALAKGQSGIHSLEEEKATTLRKMDELAQESSVYSETLDELVDQSSAEVDILNKRVEVLSKKLAFCQSGFTYYIQYSTESTKQLQAHKQRAKQLERAVERLSTRKAEIESRLQRSCDQSERRLTAVKRCLRLRIQMNVAMAMLLGERKASANTTSALILGNLKSKQHRAAFADRVHNLRNVIARRDTCVKSLSGAKDGLAAELGKLTAEKNEISAKFSTLEREKREEQEKAQSAAQQKEELTRATNEALAENKSLIDEKIQQSHVDLFFVCYQALGFGPQGIAFCEEAVSEMSRVDTTALQQRTADVEKVLRYHVAQMYEYRDALIQYRSCNQKLTSDLEEAHNHNATITASLKDAVCIIEGDRQAAKQAYDVNLKTLSDVKREFITVFAPLLGEDVDEILGAMQL